MQLLILIHSNRNSDAQFHEDFSAYFDGTSLYNISYISNLFFM